MKRQSTCPREASDTDALQFASRLWLVGSFGRGIALSGLPAPNAFGVETSGDVIALVLPENAEKCLHLFFRIVLENL